METTSKASKFLKSKLFTLLILLAVIVIFFWAFSPNHSFLKPSNIKNILNSMVLYTLFAVAEGMLIIFGEIDLSPGYVGTAAGVLMAALLAGTGIPWFIVLILCLLLGIAFGIANALLINELGFQGFIATLATGSFIARGLAYIMVGGKTINIKDEAIVWIGTGKIGDFIPFTIIISLVAILIYGIILAKTKFGRSIYLCGGNKQAARLAGLNPRKLSYILFANSGALGALAGILYAGRLKVGNLNGTNTYAFPAITAAILGGISFGGGSGGMLGCFLGLVIMNGFNNGLTVLGVTPYWQNVASGVLLLFALTLDYIGTRNATKVKKAPKSIGA
ncbi:ribose transport system permease protein [Sporobacter termitidis DSM 10068]|uniref:Autoinducer 2 import system permease protein LsrD n=1 Tax=Sporobacter termitidis DSM 10068 TaxID=1123282 RepID=A0A1M5XXM4_9FIRM|nr:ABC transporter permease [Sporobacter termitidis]SHI04565.1 ribose transport system permease protein [Sporobacter termitidis DSM 10068]